MSVQKQEETLALLSSLSQNGEKHTKHKEEDFVIEEDLTRASPLTSVHQYTLLVVLLILHGCILCSDSFLYPFFGAAAKKKGLVDTQIGIVYSAYEIVRCVAAPLYGVLITVMKPRMMCFVGGLSSGLGVVLFGLIYYAPANWFFFLCIIIRILTGNGSVMFTVAMTSGLMKVTKFKSTTIIASMEGSLAVAYTSGPVIGAGLHHIGGYTLCFVIMGIVTSLLSFLMLPTMPKIDDASSSGANFKEFIKLISIPGVFLTGFLTIALSKLAYNVITSFAAEWIYAEYGPNDLYVTVLYMVAAFSYLPGCYIFSNIISKGFVWSSMIVMMPFNCTLALLFTPNVLRILFGVVRYKWWYTVVIWALANIFHCPLELAPYEASLNLASVNGYDKDSLQLHGLLAGVVNLGLNCGAMISPLISGPITQKLGFEWNTYLSASLLFIMGILHILYLVLMKCSGKPLRPPEEKNTGKSTDKKLVS